MRLAHSMLCLAALMIATACGDAGETKPDTAPKPAPEVPAPAPPSPEPPAEPSGAPDVAGGEMNYKMFCATCHGEDGCGDGPGAAGLEPKPVKHCDGTYMNALSDEHLFKVIKDGGTAVGKSPLMTPWGGTLSDDAIRDVIAFLRSIADPPYDPAS